MTDTDFELAGEGFIREMFRITGRGWAVLLEERFSGKIVMGGILEGPSGRTTIKSVEVAHGREGSGVKDCVVAMITESDQHLFAAGQAVKFLPAVLSRY